MSTSLDRLDVPRPFAANATANVIRAMSGSAENIVLPLVLVLLLPRAQYAAWAIAFSLAAYVIYLDFGLQATIQAQVARAAGKGERLRALLIATRGSMLSLVLGVTCLAVILIVAWFLPSIYPDLPVHLVTPARQALLIIAFGQVASLQVNVLSGYWAGVGHASVSAYAMSIARVLSLLSALLIAWLGGALPFIAIGYCVPIAIAALFLSARLTSLKVIARRTGSDPPANRLARSLLVHSAPLVLWNVCLLVATGSGVVIVGRIDFDNVSIFAIGNMAFLALNGVNYALMTPLISTLGRLSVNDRQASLLALKAFHLDAVLLSGLAVVATGAALIVAPALGFGERDFVVIVGAMTVAATLRLCFTPLQAAIVASHAQGAVVWQPILDAVVSLALLLGLGSTFGAQGVAAAFALSAAAYFMLYLLSIRRASPILKAVTFGGFFSAVWSPLLIAIIDVVLLGSVSFVESDVLRFVLVATLLLAGALSLLVVSRTTRLMVRSLIGRLSRPRGSFDVE